MSTLKSETYTQVLSFFVLSTKGGDMRENEYQAYLIKKIGLVLPGALILKNDPNYLQGILDLSVIYAGRVALVEVKVSEKSKYQPNQEYYVDYLTRTGTPAFVIYPENEEEVLLALQQSLAG